MNSPPYPRITPWVGRLIIANAVILLLSLTLFTSPALVARLAFDPVHALARPWTFLTYMFVHGGLLHLLGNMLMLFVFGSAVETRMGSRSFIFYYLFCGAGAALFALGLSGFMGVSPFYGASGAVLGLGMAYAMFWPDAELILFPFPIPVRARVLVAVLAGVDVFLAILYRNQTDGIAHLAHIGGLIAGYLYFRVQTLSHRTSTTTARPVERVVMVQSSVPESSRPAPASPVRRRRLDADPVAAEVDRVLDKISAQGLSSLTAAERRFLDEVARQKKQEH
ncbi:MAG TPA: rhomboid family intramembrane serine protease [Gemmatimonadales bacterium]|jgi:rhomboid family protein|nr:rhomboid family intramembrane serine protease [Gemmatimonadales bacterium]